MTAATFDEATVRQKAADLAAVDADGAVLRAKVYSEVWALLTPEQQAKAKRCRRERTQRAGQRRERVEQRRGQGKRGRGRRRLERGHVTTRRRRRRIRRRLCHVRARRPLTLALRGA